MDKKPLGLAWTHNYFQGLTGFSTQIKYTRPNGQTFGFTLASGVWKSDADVNYSLTELKDTNSVRIGWKVVTPDNSIETYNTIGDLLKITDNTGISQTLTYSCTPVSATCPTATPTSLAPYAGLLTKVTDSFGNSLNFTYNTYGQMATMADPSGNITRYSYDSSGNLTTITYPDNTPTDLTDNPKTTYLYGETANISATPNPGVSYSHSLTGVIDENGIRTMTYQYDTNGKAFNEFSSGNIDKYSLNYAPDGSSTAVTDPLGAIRTTHFTTVLGVVKSTGTDQPGGSGCAAASNAMTYDANGNVASRTDFNGHKVCYAYDMARNLETVRVEGLPAATACPAGLAAFNPAAPARKVLTEWDSRFRLPTKITEPGLATTYAYDDKANVTEKSLKDLVTNNTRTWTTGYTYSSSGILVKKVEDGPRVDANDLTTTDYYPEDAACDGGHYGCRGQLKQITSAEGHITQVTGYTANGQPRTVVEANGLTTTLSYDARQRLVSVTSDTETTTYAYDKAGLLIKVTQPNTSFLEYSYDAAHRLTGIKDNLGNTRSYTLDALGNRIKDEAKDPQGQLGPEPNQGL